MGGKEKIIPIRRVNISKEVTKKEGYKKEDLLKKVDEKILELEKKEV